MMGRSSQPGGSRELAARTSGGTARVPARATPSAAPARIALGTGLLAILSAIIGAIVAPPQPPLASVDPNLLAVGAAATPEAVSRPVVYVQLKPGESAPPGAKVIDAAAPTPMTIVTTITAPAKPVVIKTTQSGKPVP